MTDVGRVGGRYRLCTRRFGPKFKFTEEVKQRGVSQCENLQTSLANCALVAQWSEHLAFNQLVGGSSPFGRTITSMELKQSNAGDITLEMLQRAFAESLIPAPTGPVYIWCKPNEVYQMREYLKEKLGMTV